MKQIKTQVRGATNYSPKTQNLIKVVHQKIARIYLFLSFSSLEIIGFNGEELVFEKFSQQVKWYVLTSIKVCLTRFTDFIVLRDFLGFLAFRVAKLSHLY